MPVAASAPPDPRRSTSLAHGAWVAGLALLATGVSLLISSVALDRIPHVTDDVAYAFQGKIFAAGQLFLHPPAVPTVFVHENVLLTAQRWCSRYTPGWPLLLAVGWRLGAPWVIDPLLLALSIVGVWRLGRALFDPTTGILAATALAVSPFALVMSAGFLAHGPELCAVVWCLLFLVRGSSGKGNGGALLAAGLLGGYAVLIRPLTALLVLAPAVAWALLRLRRERRSARAVLWLALGVLPCAAAFLLYDRALFGAAFLTGYAASDPARYGSIQSMAATPAEALGRNLPWFLAQLDRSLWGLPFPDLLLLLPLLLPRPGRSRDLMLLSCAATLVLGYCFYFYPRDVIYSGPRFAFEALAPLSLLAARSLTAAYSQVAGWLTRIRRPALGRRLRLAILGLGSAALLYFPLGQRLPAEIIRHAQWYMFVSGEPMRRATAAGVGLDALVFVAGTSLAYPTFFLQNDFPLTAGRVFVRDIPPLRGEVVRAYPRREIWQVKVVVESLDPVLLPEFGKALEVSWTRLQ